MTRTTRLLAAASAVIAGLAVMVSASPAQAMGTGNPFQDMQVGVTYTVYQPSFTAGLKTPTQASGSDSCPSGTEENLVVTFGAKSGPSFTVIEGNPICSDPAGAPAQQVMAFQVRGATAKVFAYCDPAASCRRQDVRKLGGFVRVTLPAASGLRKTSLLVITNSSTNLSARQLVHVTRSMSPVAG